jgi:signal transduction histidine kinase
MYRSWTSFVIAGAVTCVLTLFVGLQYRWLEQASEAERERMQKRVATETERFAEEFNQELQSAFFNFQTGADLWRSEDRTEFNDRYEYWVGRTAYPDLIRRLVFVGSAPGAAPIEFDIKSREFRLTAADGELGAVMVRVATSNTVPTVIEDLYALVGLVQDPDARSKQIVILRNRGEPPRVEIPPRLGHLIVFLDETTIKDRMLPDLARKYFPDGDYDIAVMNRSDEVIFGQGLPSTNCDASAGLWDLSPNSLIFFANRDTLPAPVSAPKGRVVVTRSIESHSVATPLTEAGGDMSEAFRVEMKTGDRSVASMITRTAKQDDTWKLNVRHAAGSIDAFVNGERNKSLAVGFVVYLLLVGSIVAIVVSAMRSKQLAQRQIDFVSSVSHEFRTPLAVIYSAGENLADGVANDRGTIGSYGELIKGEGRKLSAMVEQILEFAGADAGHRMYKFEDTDVNAVVRSAVENCRPLINKNGVLVSIDDEGFVPEIKADGGALEQAIQNLLVNAAKYGGIDNEIRIAARYDQNRVKVSVSDRGFGIKRGDLTRIFEPFYRARSAVDAQIHGNGLGLALVKQIAEAHGGTVTAESEFGVGSKFTIELPVRRS